MALAGGSSLCIPAPRVGCFTSPGSMVSAVGRISALRRAGRLARSSAAVSGLVVLQAAGGPPSTPETGFRRHPRIGDQQRRIGEDGYARRPTHGRFQADVIAKYAVSGVIRRPWGYVGCHGTSFPLGDPIEVRALTAFECRRQPFGPLCSGVGRSRASATWKLLPGIAGLIKTILCLKKKGQGTTRDAATPAQAQVAPGPKSVRRAKYLGVRAAFVVPG